MVIKYGNLFVCIGTAFSYGEWMFSNVILADDNVLKIDVVNDSGIQNMPRKYTLSPEWFIITSRPLAAAKYPPLPDNKKQDGLFALTQPSEVTIWFLTSSKYERNQWIEKILPIITANPPTPPEPPPPYSEYDNLSYFPWDTTVRTTTQVREHNAFTLPRPSIHRSGFYSLERPIRKPPKPVEPIPVTPEPPPPSEPLTAPAPRPPRDSLQCVNCFSLGCACICNMLSVCLQMCCSNFSSAF